MVFYVPPGITPVDGSGLSGRGGRRPDMNIEKDQFQWLRLHAKCRP